MTIVYVCGHVSYCVCLSFQLIHLTLASCNVCTLLKVNNVWIQLPSIYLLIDMIRKTCQKRITQRECFHHVFSMNIYSLLLGLGKSHVVHKPQLNLWSNKLFDIHIKKSSMPKWIQIKKVKTQMLTCNTTKQRSITLT